MIKKPLVVIALLALTWTLGACGQAQPNAGTRYDSRGPSQIQPGNDINSESDGGSEKQSELEAGRILETNFSGLGTVTYQVTSVELVESWEAVGISADKLTNERELRTGDRIMLVYLTVKNADVPSDAILAQEASINCFHTVTREQLEEESSTSADGLPGPMGPAGIEPSYFDNAFYENGAPSDKRYFQYELPTAGESIEVVVGWVIPAKEILALENNEMYLQHIVSGELLLIQI